MESDDEIKYNLPDKFETNLYIDGDLFRDLQILVAQRQKYKVQLMSSFRTSGQKNRQDIDRSVSRHIGNQLCKITRKLADRLQWLDTKDIIISPSMKDLCKAFSYKMSNLTALVLSEDFMYSRELICKIAYNCPNLRHISLPHCHVAHDDVLLYFARKLQNLKVLLLDYPKPLTDIGCRNICTHLVNLVILELAYINITDAAIEYIGNLKHLQQLYLEGCENITADCINILSNCGSRLEQLDVSFCDGVDPNEALQNLGLSRLPLLEFLFGSDVQTFQLWQDSVLF